MGEEDVVAERKKALLKERATDKELVKMPPDNSQSDEVFIKRVDLKPQHQALNAENAQNAQNTQSTQSSEGSQEEDDEKPDAEEAELEAQAASHQEEERLVQQKNKEKEKALLAQLQ